MHHRSVFFIAFFCIFLGSTHGATVLGETYGADLEKIRNVVIEINSTPAQTIVLDDGSYYVELPQGTYLLTARFFENQVTYVAEEELTITNGSGRYIVDLILLPDIEENYSIETFDEEHATDLFSENLIPIDGTYLLGVIICIFLAGVFLLRTRTPAGRQVIKNSQELPSDLKDLIEIIKRHDGRITQKELRAEIPLSEAKVSLMISDLEDRGILRKIKKGRSNIVVLASEQD